MPGITAGAVPQQADGLPFRETGHGHSSHQEDRCRLANVDAIPVRCKGPGHTPGHDLQRRETVDGEQRKTVDAATQHRITQPKLQKSGCTGQGPRTGCAGRGNGVADAREAILRLNEVHRRAQQLMRLTEGAFLPMTVIDHMPKGRQVFVHPGRGGAQHHPDPIRPETAAGSGQGRFHLCHGVP